MKKFSFILVLLLLHNLSQLNAKNDFLVTIPRFTELTNAEIQLRKVLAVSARTRDFPPVNKLCFVEQNSQKGIVYIGCLGISGNYLLVNFFDCDLFSKSQTFHHQHLFFINEKRGPPSA